MQEQSSLPSPGNRLLLAFTVPLLGSVVLGALIATLVAIFFGRPQVDPSGRASTALILGGIGIVSLLLGLRWYRPDEMGLRGGRPLYAGLGFATLGWLVFLLGRFLVTSNPRVMVAPDFSRAFLYLFLFEALAIQLWTFGLLFRPLAQWRGPLTAAVTSGIIFGALASQFFAEAYVETVTSIFYFFIWGVFYGLIRLRTGSLLGTAIVQAMQSLTAWYILLPAIEPERAELHQLYLFSATFYLIFIWRLWPKTEEDYRV